MNLLCKRLAPALMLLLVAIPVLAACPVGGEYRSSLGTMALGRAAEGWCGASGHPVEFGQPGNALHLMSWNGGVLGGQWHIFGLTVNAAGAVLVDSYMTPQGIGWKDYLISYDGGQFWLAGNNAWSGDGQPLTGIINSFSISVRVNYFLNQVDGATSNVSMTGAFDGCSECVFQYVLADGLLAWRTGWPNMPTGYPELPCNASVGELTDVCSINARINCAVTDESETWSDVKSLFR
jgi:hypothetical protein